MPKEKRKEDLAEEEDLEKKNWRPYATEYDPIKVSSLNGIGTVPHDNGVIRALESNYKPNPCIPESSKLCKTLFIGKLGPLVAESEVKNLFCRYGKIISVKVIRDIVTNRSKGYGFVEFEKERHCERAYRDGKNISLTGNALIVDKTHSRSMLGWKPRRLGGGFGGTKDSGQMRFGCVAKPWLRPLFKSERKRRRTENN